MTYANESAFPEVQEQPQFNYHTYGLTKREYFASMAMQGILSNRELQMGLMRENVAYSKVAVDMADSLINELNKEK